jgi:hypothetical protein
MRAQVQLQGRADTAYAAEWDAQEQAALDAALGRYPVNLHPPLERYVRAAAQLPKKCARPALRCPLAAGRNCRYDECCIQLQYHCPSMPCSALLPCSV